MDYIESFFNKYDMKSQENTEILEPKEETLSEKNVWRIVDVKDDTVHLRDNYGNSKAISRDIFESIHGNVESCYEEAYLIEEFEEKKEKESMFREESSDEEELFMESEKLELFLEAAIKDGPRLRDFVYTKIEQTLAVPEQDRKAKRIVNQYIERNMDKLCTPGPLYQVIFGDTDKAPYYELFGINPKEIQEIMITITKETGSSSKFLLLRQNPIFVILYFLIRYYTIKNDKVGINVFVSMFSIAIYPSIFKKYYPKGVNEAVMKYTIDSLTNKFLIKKANTLFGVLNDTAARAYSFHKERIIRGTDLDVVSYIQRVHNDQNSMFKKITSEYKKNYDSGNYVSTRNTDYDKDSPIIDGDENATSIVQYLVEKISLPMISGGVDVVYAEAAAKTAKISVSDCRMYLLKIMTPKNLPRLQKFLEAFLFLYIYEDKNQALNIKSGKFLLWADTLFKKTNSKNPNIITINQTLDIWAEESGIFERFSRKASRINYKKAIFLYIVFMIQKFA